MEQGYDPRNFSLVAFGGAGPLHANALGKLLGAYPVIIPPSPGVLCALGEATTILRHEIGKAFTSMLADTSTADVLGELDGLLAQMKTVMSEDQGVPEKDQVSKQSCLGRHTPFKPILGTKVKRTMSPLISILKFSR